MTCTICGPQEEPGRIHSICHTTTLKHTGCGHPLDDHTNSMRCRICDQDCGHWSAITDTRQPV